MTEENRWLQITNEDPEHSSRYIERFEKMEAEGRDLGGEARFIDAMAERRSRILDAGCGPGRVGALLHQMGHSVVGVDLDPVLIASAQEKHPGPTWVTGDLAVADLVSEPVGGNFDIVVSAGNVMRFLAPDSRVAVLSNLGGCLAESGRAVLGFGTGGGDYDFGDFFADVETAELTVELTMSAWDLRPFSDTSEFLIAILTRRH